MHRVALVLVLASCLATACRSGAGSTKDRAVATPTVEDAFRIQFELMARKDVDGLWAIYSDGMKKRMEDMARNVRKLTPSAFQRQFGFPRAALEGLSTREVIKAITMSPTLKQDGVEIPTIQRKIAQGPITILQFQQRGRRCLQRFSQVGGQFKVEAPIDCRSDAAPGGGHGPGDGHDHGPGGMPGLPGLPGMPGQAPLVPPPVAPMAPMAPVAP